MLTLPVFFTLDLDESRNVIIPFAPFEKSFSDDPEDYFCFGEQVPPMNLKRSLRKGDILEVTILSITNPGSFHVKIIGPEHIFDSQSQDLNRLTEKMTAFYEKFKFESVVKIEDPGFLEGKLNYRLRADAITHLKY